MNRSLRNRLRRLEQTQPIVPNEREREKALAAKEAERAKVLAHPDGPALLAEMEVIEARYSEDCPSVEVFRQRTTRDPRWAELVGRRVAIFAGMRLAPIDPP
jgi:hypothetical protein